MSIEDAVEQVALAVRSGIEFFHRLVNPYIMRKEADARLYAAKRDMEIEQLKFENYDSTMRRMPDMLHESCEIHKDLNMTWFLNFHDIVERISDDDIQNLFAAIMAGELESPGRCSVRTMRIIADLSRDEAELFKKASGCVIRLDNKWIIPKQDRADEHNPLRYEDHLLLEDCGLLQTSGVSSYHREFNGEYTQMNYQDHLLGVIAPREDRDRLLIMVKGISKLKKAGEELYDILMRYDMAVRDDDFFIHYAKHLAETEKDLSVQLFRSKRRDDGDVVANGPDMIDKNMDEIERLMKIPVM